MLSPIFRDSSATKKELSSLDRHPPHVFSRVQSLVVIPSLALPPTWMAQSVPEAVWKPTSNPTGKALCRWVFAVVNIFVSSPSSVALL